MDDQNMTEEEQHQAEEQRQAEEQAEEQRQAEEQAEEQAEQSAFMPPEEGSGRTVDPRDPNNKS